VVKEQWFEADFIKNKSDWSNRMSYLKGWQHVQVAIARLRAWYLQGNASSDKSIVNDGMVFMMNSDVDVCQEVIFKTEKRLSDASLRKQSRSFSAGDRWSDGL
jgi:hypothetical protein